MQESYYKPSSPLSTSTASSAPYPEADDIFATSIAIPDSFPDAPPPDYYGLPDDADVPPEIPHGGFCCYIPEEYREAPEPQRRGEIIPPEPQCRGEYIPPEPQCRGEYSSPEAQYAENIPQKAKYSEDDIPPEPQCDFEDPAEPFVPVSALPDLPIPKYLQSAANIKPAEHAFLLGDKRFPIGEIAIIAGAGGVGKGQLAAAHIALTSRGHDLAGKPSGMPQRCLFITAEDTAEDVKRRLERSMFKADSTKVFILDKANSFEHEMNLSEPEGSLMLQGWIMTTGAKLVYIDPLQAFVGDYTDLSRQNHVRRIMHALATVAEETQCCIVLLMHLNKRQQIVSAADLLCGSSDIVNASRSAMLLTNDFMDGMPDRRYLFHIKSNHARRAETLEINISSAGNRIAGTSEVTAEDYVMAVNSRKANKAARGEVNYEQMFYSGVEQMIAEGKFQSTFREFVERFAPGFQGRAKFVFDDIAVRVEEKLGYVIQTKTSDSCPVKINRERGFRLVKL